MRMLIAFVLSLGAVAGVLALHPKLRGGAAEVLLQTREQSEKSEPRAGGIARHGAEMIGTISQVGRDATRAVTDAAAKTSLAGPAPVSVKTESTQQSAPEPTGGAVQE